MSRAAADLEATGRGRRCPTSTPSQKQASQREGLSCDAGFRPSDPVELHSEDCLCVACDDVPVFPPCHNIDPAVPVTLAEAASWES